MRKKISSFVTALLILVACVFATACGDKYEDLKFKVYYAFTADATEWYDGTDGISLNYNPEDVYDGGERTSLIFDGDTAQVFVKIKIKNVDAEDVGKITVSPTSMAGFSLSSNMVSQNKVFSLNLNGNVDTTLRLYENNSGKRHSTPVVVSRELEGISADVSVAHAMPITSLSNPYPILNLAELDNLEFQPVGLTNQTAVTYSIESIGYYSGGGYIGTISTDDAAQYVSVVNNKYLRIDNSSFYSEYAYVVQVKVASALHDGTDGEPEIATVFDVYLTDGTISAPTLKFDSATGLDVGSEINIYENGGLYAKSTISVCIAEDLYRSIYASEREIYGGVVSYDVAFYVLGKDGIYREYDYMTQNNDADTQGRNGLYITKKASGLFELSIINRDVKTNIVKVVYKINGLTFDQETINANATTVNIVKSVLPTCITVNDVVDLENGDVEEIEILGTTTASYKGLKLKLTPNPNESASSVINFEYDSNKLLITDSRGAPVSTEVPANSIVYVKFKTGVSGEQTLKIKTPSTPSVYNGVEVAKQYITVIYKLNEMVTADKFEFVQNETGGDVINETHINADGDYIYAKVYYTGSMLAESTIKLTSSNSNILFSNNQAEIMLNAGFSYESGKFSGQNYRIYQIPIRSSGIERSGVSIFVDDESVALKEEISVSAVYLMSDEAVSGLHVDALKEGVKKFASTEDAGRVFTNFAVARGEYVDFEVRDSNNRANTIAGIALEDDTSIVGDEFNTSALSCNVISNNMFVAYGRRAGYTHVLKLNVSFYIEDEDTGLIVKRNSTLNVQVAVYDPIGVINVELQRKEIGYSNPYYVEAGTTSAKIQAYTSTYGTPVEKIVFYNDIENLVIENVSQLRVSSNLTYVETGAISLTFISETNEEIDLISSGLLYKDNTSFLKGTINVHLNTTINLKEVALTVTALKFGEAFDVNNGVKIKILTVEQADGIVVSGNNLKFDDNGSYPELTLSFMDVEDENGYDEKSFNASLRFDDSNSESKGLRFDDINTALTYVLYQYQTDEKGQLVVGADGKLKQLRVDNSTLNVTFNDGVVTVKARKKLGGGIFKLVLATKDSYSLGYDPNSIILLEDHFSMKSEILVRVEDGELGSEYTIRNEVDLKKINYNLDKHFVLGQNIGVDDPICISPLGQIGSSVYKFSGSLNGEKTTILEDETKTSESYSIYLYVKNMATVAEGNLYGLFAWLDEDAVIKNIEINASFAGVVDMVYEKGYVGAVAGINDGTIENVVVRTDSANLKFQDDISFGLIAGWNSNKIVASTARCNGKISISVNGANNDIGLVAGLNKDETRTPSISGKYVGKESLDGFMFDVVADLYVQNVNTLGTVTLNVGAVVGANYGAVSGILAGGKIEVETKSGSPKPTGSLGGLVGFSAGSGNSVKQSIALSLNVVSKAENVNVGGIIGEAEGTVIDYVKYVSATTVFAGYTVLGEISGITNVGGLVGSMNDGSITYSSVESFVDYVLDAGTGDYETFYTINKGNLTAGLVANGTPTSITCSFVSANISASNQIYLTASVAGDNTYFVGLVNDKTKVKAVYPTYRVVNGEYDGSKIDLISIMQSITVSAETEDWTNIYLKNADGTYTKAETFEATRAGDYVKFNTSEWSDSLDGIVDNSIWGIKENYNVANVKGVNLFFPYLIRSWDHDEDPVTQNKTESLQIVKPLSITADVSEDYCTIINSVYVEVFDYSLYAPLVEETIIVNYFEGNTVANTRNILDRKDTIEADGLLDASLLPEDAQGGYDFTIIGNGRLYAYINDSKQIVFTGASGSTPILVRIYSVFNPTLELYVAFYSQSLFTDLTLTSSSIYQSDFEETGYNYEINLYTGQNNKIISLGAENVYNSGEYATLFDIYGISQNLQLISEMEDDTKLRLSAGSFESITLKIKDELTDDEKIGTDEYELIKFKLYVASEYFGTYSDGSDTFYYVDRNIPLGTLILRVNLYNSAKSIVIDGSDCDSEFTTNDDINFNVTLTTDFVETTQYDAVTEKPETTVIGDDGEIYAVVANTDGIKVVLEIVDGQDEVDKLLKLNGVDHFTQLFNCNIISSLYKTEKENKVLGYKFNVTLELIDEHNYRYIENNIKFSIIVYATSNEAVNNVNSPMQLVMKPAMLSTLRMENYTVSYLDVNTDYTSIVSNTDIQTSIVEPGGLGNLMMIYLEPSYANIVNAKIKTSSVYVPSLGKNFQLKFTQLVLDERGPNKAFSTLAGELAETQVDDTLNLRLISSINSEGKMVYNGVICVYIQLEHFAGLEASLTVELSADTNNGVNVKRTKNLITSYLPSVDILYDTEKEIKTDHYLIQKGTHQNQVSLKIMGYQFNSNPTLSFDWALPEDGSSGFKYDGENKYCIFIDANDNGILDGDETSYLTGDYISYYLNKAYDEIVYDPTDDSYTLTLWLNIAEKIPTSFTLSASLSLTTKDGQLQTSKVSPITFCPTEYILNSVSVAELTNSNSIKIPLDASKTIALQFETDNEVNDMTAKIYQDLLNYAESKGNTLSTLAKMFSYKNSSITFADTELHPEFNVNLINDLISITAIDKFNETINIRIWYGYKQNANGDYSIDFSKQDMSIDCSFTLNLYVANHEVEIPIYEAEEIYNSSTGTWYLVEGANYVLMNDITLENVVPITTAIGSFDGNNRVISIKSFKVDVAGSDYGLFASIGTYNVEDEETETTLTRQTLLKNIIVNYGNFVGSVALNNSQESVVFGGLVAKNNGGLIYNCDVMNLKLTDKKIEIIVASNAKLTFGGLVGENSGIITNSRVGRDSYNRITAANGTESVITNYAGGLTFEIFNQVAENESVNSFESRAGGFVGNNSGTISTSYVANTNVINYSTNEKTNMTSGFVATNTGTISYSYAKADDSTMTSSQPYSKGYTIENRGNGIVSGFVYQNSGNINNSYANIELKTLSAYISGFVYNNTGTISESYAASTMNAGSVDSYAEQPFVGVNSAGDLLSTGTLENTYYLMRSQSDNPYTDGDKDYAQALNEENFQIGEYLIGFSFVLSNSKVEREQGVWSYYTLDSKKRILPELMNANTVSHSYRYIVENDKDGSKKFINAVSYALGTANNPYTISSVDEFNNVFTYNGNGNSFVGYVRLINDIDFKNDETAVKTRANFKLGTTSTKTSFEGNGMSISGIYLDVGEAVVDKIGLFGEVENAYIKNLTLNFATPKTDGQFSTSTAIYSGGLAGKITNSAIININLNGPNTTLTGSNFVGGVAGMISGTSLVYGITTNLSAKTYVDNSYLYYSESDYKDLNIALSTYHTYDEYIKRLSYAGAVAGVLDLTSRPSIEYNVQFIDVHGDQMSAKIFNAKQDANISASYSGGVAGYASAQTQSFKLRYFMGENEIISGSSAVGGLYGVSLGRIVASQVSAEEEIQYAYDTDYGTYIKSLNSSDDVKISELTVGNTTLLQGKKYVGGLVGVGVNSTITASYSKASISSGEIVGGLIGASVASTITYSYAIPYINFHEGMKYGGGLIGSAYKVNKSTDIDRNSAIRTYEILFKHKNKSSNYTEKSTNIQSTYSSLILDNENLNKQTNVKFDFVVADYETSCLQSGENTNLTYVYSGIVNYSNDTNGVVANDTYSTNKTSKLDLFKLYNVGDPTQIVAFQEVFSGWSIIKYWTLNEEKYFPLLNNKVVNNYIDIERGDDFKLLETNPTGKFRVVKDVEVTVSSNWVVAGSEPFRGTLIGEKKGDSSRPKIIIKQLKPNTNEQSAGFFKHTFGATITNLVFEWDSQINLSDTTVENLTMVSGLVCEDTNSLISNVEVLATKTNGYIVNTTAYGSNKTIGGFGGIVGSMTNTNILGSSFVGKVKADLLAVTGDDIYVGGTVGFAQTKKDPNTDQSAVINNSQVGASTEDYTLTEFELSVNASNDNDVYIGGTVGKAVNVAVASCGVGGINYYSTHQRVNMTVILTAFKANNMYFGGIAGWAEDGMITNCDGATDITILGTTQSGLTNNVYVGGLMGAYALANPSSTTGISNCNALSNISTTKESDNLVSDKSRVVLSTGVAMLYNYATVKQSLFKGEITTEGSGIGTLYAGGAVGIVDTNNVVKLQEISTLTAMLVGSEQTENLYAGGLIAYSDNVEVSYSVSWGRIIPITKETATDIYAGGLIGKLTDRTTVKNTYTTSSIVTDSIADASIAKLNIGALVGSIPDSSTSANISFNNVFYSSDYALCADENYVDGDVPLGMNLSAETIIFEDSWQEGLRTDGEENPIWAKFTVREQNDYRMPYQTALYEDLINYEVIKKGTGETQYDYIEGDPMRPKQIRLDTAFDQNKYTYYLLKLNGKTTPTLTKGLYGILIGEDLSIDKTFRVGTLSEIGANGEIDDTYYGIIPAVFKHSAISNLHVVVDSELTLTGNVGIIAGLNNGVIFNSSVQGSEIKTTGSSILGLIACVNRGMISHSFSTAEVVATESVIGGITYLNDSGKLLYNYFTGYIEGQNAAGIVCLIGSGSDAGYIYNNYMSGVIKGITSGNAFHACTSIVGANNFIDSYSDIVYRNKEFDEAAYKILKPVSTASLMAAENFDGKWHSTVDDGNFNTALKTFGLNYNYPIYRFNKMIGKSMESMELNDWKNQLSTGTGEYNHSYVYKVDSEGLKCSTDNGITWTDLILIEDLKSKINNPGNKEIEFRLHDQIYVQYKFEDAATWDNLMNLSINSMQSRYQMLVNSDSEDYRTAFKIPHLGILTAAHNLLDVSKNYVLIYDLDGKYGVDEHGQDLYEKWRAIGSQNTTINNFRPKEVSGFNGVFISNRYYNFNDAENRLCTVSHLSQEGLFANVEQSVLADLALGTFTELSNSGALGTAVLGKDIKNNDNEVYVNNIFFVPDEYGVQSKIQGASGATFGGLFGSIGGYLSVGNFSNSFDDGGNTKPAAVIMGGKYAGLIAGELGDGVIELLSATSSYYAKFSGCEMTGGVVGLINSSSVDSAIKGNYNTITLYSNVSGDEYNTAVGGVAADSTGGGTVLIEEINISFEGEPIQLYTNSFGGVVARLNIPLTVNKFKLTAQSSEVSFNSDEDIENRFFGLIVGLQNAKLEVNSFTLESVEKIIVGCSFGLNYSVVDEDCGVGLYVGGKLSGELLVSNAIFPDEIELKVTALPNVGGLIGYVGDGGTIDVAKPNKIILTGTTNVGGLVGYFNSNIKYIVGEDPSSVITTFANNLLTTSDFAEINVEGSLIYEHQNFGGIFGKMTGVSPEEISIDNKNVIKIGVETAGKVKNVGGVIGFYGNDDIVALAEGAVETKANLYNLKNSADFGIENSNLITEEIILSGDGSKTTTQLINVGGVIGFVSKNVRIEKSYNTAKVMGYQNVGGIVGFLSDNSSIKNSVSFETLENPSAETLKSYITTIQIDANNVLAVNKADDDTAGSVYGVINVGGAVGYAGTASVETTTISNVGANANVYGNANVGGLVGLTEGSRITNSHIYSITEVDEYSHETTILGYAKAIYYKVVQNNEEKTFIPTSVGGLAGTLSNSKVTSNILGNVVVSSTQEGFEGNVAVNTFSNYMLQIAVGKGNDVPSYATNFIDLNTTTTKLDFADIKSGFGGLAGTIDKATMHNTEDLISENYMKDININAQLGVNVGTYYGVYRHEPDSQDPAEPAAHAATSLVSVPYLYGTNVMTDGSYNIGGIVGFIDVNGQELQGLSNEDLPGSANLTIQSRMVGMYVGGLVGKTNSSTITDFNIESGKNVNISIHTDNCYYAGGLIGRAEVSSNVEISGDLGTWTYVDETDDKVDNGEWKITGGSDDIIADTQDNCANFGGLIGMLKVGYNANGLSVNVSGKHKMPFTINTIENQNYYDGDSEFSYNTDDGIEQEIELEAEAYYINKDTFNIDGSSDKTLYSNNNTDIKDSGGNVIDPADRNPLNPKAKGWSKQYTGFRIMQRNIPMAENNGAEWDSIAVLFDAAQITHVATIGNLGLSGVGLPFPNKETKVFEDDHVFGDDHICYTIYEQADGKATLYSAIGIASLYYESMVDDPGTPNNEERTELAEPHDRRATLLDYIWGFINDQSPQEIRYINYNVYDDNNSRGLTYFNWIGEYQSMGDDGKGAKEGISYQNNINEPHYLAFNVPNYLDYKYYKMEKHKDVNKDGIDDYKFSDDTIPGAWFVFDVVYENASVDGQTYSANQDKNLWDIIFKKDEEIKLETEDTYLPTSGSIFEVTGVMTPEVAAYQLNENAIDWFAIGSKIVKFIAAVVLVYVTGGGSLAMLKGAASTIGSGIKVAAQFVVKFAVKNKLATAALILTAGLTGYVALQSSSAKTYSNFTEPSYVSYGFVSTTFSKTISYNSVDNITSMVSDSDYRYANQKGNLYEYYSHVRPADYHTCKYVGMEITGMIELNDNKYEFVEDSEIENLEDLTGEYESIDNSLLTDSDGNSAIQTITLLAEGEEDEVLIANIEGKTYLIFEKYEYKYGQYYIFSLYGDVRYQRVSFGFEPPSNETHFVQRNNSNYVHGSFDSTNGYYYYFDDNDDDLTKNNVYAGNNITYDNADEKYSVNGFNIDTNLVENEETSLRYVIDTSHTPGNVGNGLLGYDYFDKVYFTANGTQSIKYNGSNLVRYATFGNPSPENPNGNLRAGIDYVVRNYQYDETVTNADGEEIVVPRTVPYYYYLQDTPFAYIGTADPTKLTGEGEDGYPSEITVAVYPGTFVNPYTAYPNLKSSNTTNDGDAANNTYTWYYNNTATNQFISFNPKYFLYEGGYVTSNNNVFIKVDESEYKSGEKYDVINVTENNEPLSFKDMITDWETCKGYTSVKYGETLSSIYQVKDGILYKRYPNYIIKDGLLHMYFTDRSEENLNLYEGLYLTNSDVGLYTRYKYSANENPLDLSEVDSWNGYKVVPKSGGTSINSNQPTKLTESVRVVLNAGEIRIGKQTEVENSFITKEVGKIIIN